jgi:hypothetical protein
MANYNKNKLNINPADNESMAGLLQYAMSEYQKGIQSLIPAKIINYNSTTNRASVQLLINILTTSGDEQVNAQIASIPVFEFGGAGYFISFNFQPGDLGWVFATDRDISGFLNTYSAAAPAVNLIKNFSSSFFLPDFMKPSGLENPGLLITNKTGDTKITLSTDGISITSDNIVLNGNVVVTGSLNASNITPESGTLAVTGNITATGSIVPYS